MNQEFMKERPVLPLVISMALPMTLSMLVNALYNIVDSYFVAKISEDAMTALSLVYPLQNVVSAVTVGFSIGINAVIAFYLGAEKRQLADQAASLGMLFNWVHGLLLTIGCISIMPYFLRMFTREEQIIEMGLEYSGIVFLFCIPIAAAICFEKIFQAVGNMKETMLCMMSGCVVNIILDPLLIFGIGFFPALGIRGAAIATGIGQVVTLIAYLFTYFIKPIPVKVRLRDMKFSGELVRKIYGIGVPATFNMALPSVQVSALNSILAGYSAGYVLVLGAYYKLQTFLYLTANGVVQGMRPLLGYNYGAQEMERVSKILKTALCLIAAVMMVGTILCLCIPENLIGLFTANGETVKIGRTALRIIARGFLLSTIPVTLSGALEGLGKGKESLMVCLLRYIVVMLPAAFLLSRFLGADGVWNAFWITELVTAAVSLIVYRNTMKMKKQNN